MKYLNLIFGMFLLFLIFTFPSIAKTDSPTEQIKNFQQSMVINTDGTIDVTEKILYDFGNKRRHGIFRKIPYTKFNKEKKKFKMTFSNISVVDERGIMYLFSQTDESEAINLKIGDPNITISGRHMYEVRYRVSGAINYFSDHDELYWNVIGNDWTVPIQKAESNILLPRAIAIDDIQRTCFFGLKGSSSPCTYTSLGLPLLFVQQNITPGEDMTIVVGFPKSIVEVLEPTEVANFFESFIGRLVIISMMFVGFVWYIVYPLWLPFKWWKEGRDPERVSEGIIRAWFDPPKINGRDLTPAETGTLIDERVDTRELAALIIHLAQRGYLKIIEQKKKEFDLVKQDLPMKKDNLLPFEYNFLTKLFATTSHVSLKKSTSFESVVSSTTDKIYEQTVNDGLFPKHPDAVRKKYSIIAGFAIISFNFFLALSAGIFGRIMPRKTLEGVHISNTAKSLKNFLISQERQLEFQADKQLMFEKLLPYAIAFGVEKIWAERFKGLTLKNVNWYQSTSAKILTANILTNSLHSNFAHSMQSAMTPESSSSSFSSGFSGGSSGGGGGGGGGSW